MAAAIERLLFGPGVLQAAEEAVAALGPRRHWDAVLAQLLEAVHGFAADGAPAATDRLSMPLGQKLQLRRTDSTRPDLASALADSVRDGPGWLPPEDWGAGLAGGPARLRLPLPPGTAGPLRLNLELRAEGGRPVRLTLFADSAPAGTGSIPDPPAGDFATAIPVEVAEGTGVLELELDAPRGTGLRGLMLCRDDDLLARLDFLEGQRLPALGKG